MSDEHRTDHVGCYGRAHVQTPNIDRLADGTVFTNCLSSNPVCTPARAALLTGKYSHQVGMLEMSGDLSPQHPTYPQAMQRAGWYTAGVGKFHWLQGWPWGTPAGQGHDLIALEPQLRAFGFDYLWEASGKQLAVVDRCRYGQRLRDKGLWDAYRDYVTVRKIEEKKAPNVDVATYPDGEPFPLPEEDYPDIVIADQLIEWIRGRPKDRPFCLFGSFVGPHPPYDPPQRYLEAVPYEEVDDFVSGQTLPPSEKKRYWKLRRAYRAMVRCTDEQIGRVLDTLRAEGLWDETVVLFTSDHGTMLGDRGIRGKGWPWLQSCMVPLIVRHPDALAGTTNDSPVELTDVTATILDLAGLDPLTELSKPWPAFHDRVPCRSVMPIVTGQASRIRDFAFSENSGWEMIQTSDWLYVHNRLSDDPDRPSDEFYDRRRDPNTVENRIDDPGCQDAITWCRNRLQAVRDKTPPAQTQWAPFGGARVRCALK